MDAEGLGLAYDYLFDFINGSTEFAQAVRQYIPWIETPQDVITFLDNSLQFTTLADTGAGRCHSHVTWSVSRVMSCHIMSYFVILGVLTVLACNLLMCQLFFLTKHQFFFLSIL